jgi:ribonucleoside-diphosphate reductase alpha chain
MFVIKRDGLKEAIKFDKISNRIQKLLTEFGIETVDPATITLKIASRIFSGITTTELDNLASQICMQMITETPDYGKLGGLIAVSNHQKNTPDKFVDVVKALSENKDVNGEICPLVSDELLDIVLNNADEIESMIDYSRDFLIDFFGFKTLERSYLLKLNTSSGKKILERPQHLFMRVAIGIHGMDYINVEKTYNGMSLKNYTMATPTLFNAGTPINQMSSCFLTTVGDSIESIFDIYRECGIISKWAGGIGCDISDIRSKGSYIRKTGGESGGVLPLLKTFNSIANQFDQGGKRMGSFAMFIPPYHADIFAFLDAKKPHGADKDRARDLFYGLWVCDLFMKRVESSGDWYLMDPGVSKGLNDVYGEEFENLYQSYVNAGKYVKKIKSREVWDAIICSQTETGLPYICYKDHVNKKSNQKNIGVVRSSNLCVSGETMILTSNGYYDIKSLENKDIEVWNGKEWSKTTVRKTGENQKLINIEFSNGMSVKCTPYHKFYIEKGNEPSKKSVSSIITAENLKIGMKIIRYNTGVVNDNKNDMKYPYTHGMFCGDGTYSSKMYFENDNFCGAKININRPMLSLYGLKKELIEYLDYDSKGTYDEKQDKINLSLPYNIDDKFYVPINNSLSSKIKWLEGYFDADGCVITNNGLKNIQAVSIHKEFLVKIVYLLQTIGIISYIGKPSKRSSILPDGKGGKKIYDTKQTYRINIDSSGLNTLVGYGFSPKRLDISNLREKHHITNRFVLIKNIIDNNEHGDTYCFNEPNEHRGIFNGIIMGQCVEIVEVANKDQTSVCLTADTIIFTENGPRKIVECDGENILSYFKSDTDFEVKQQYIKAKLIDNGKKEVFEIDLTGGFPIKATKDHKFLVISKRNGKTKKNSYSWKTVEELDIKDKICRPNIDPLPKFKDVDIILQTEKNHPCFIESLTVGWMLGDGWQSDNKRGISYGVCFGPKEIYAQNIVLNKLKEIHLSLPVESIHGRDRGVVNPYVQPNGVVNWQTSKKSFIKYFKDNYGLNPSLGKHKYISEIIKNLEPYKIASVLSGLFSADGTVYKTEDRFYVAYTSASKQLLIDIQVLLKCFGIVSCLVYGDVKNRDTSQGKLTIENRSSIKLYAKYINFLLCPDKQIKLEEGIKTHIYKKNVDQREWMHVRGIKSIGIQKVYDLNIPNTHNFVANMVLTHNCNLASICLQNMVEYKIESTGNEIGTLKNTLTDYYKYGDLYLYSKEDCVYCKLLKALLKDCGLRYTEIEENEAIRLRSISRNISSVNNYDTVPQLFSKYSYEFVYLGGYDDAYKKLKPRINYDKLAETAYELCINLNKVIDKNFYPVEKTRVSNMQNRPIGIGVQGLADLFFKLKIPFDSVEASSMNKKIFETIYYGAMMASLDLAKTDGCYSRFKGSPLSEGKLQFDLWGLNTSELSGRWDWKNLRKDVMKYGVRNSLLVALMPTASTAQIMGSYVEAFEVQTSNLYTRRTLAGEFTIINPYLTKDLIDIGLWNEDIINRLIYDKGSVQRVKGLPKILKDVYKTVYEISQKTTITLSADRSPFVCQSQSLNLFFESPSLKVLTQAHFLGWKLGLKTGSYYIRSKPASTGQRFGIDPEKEKEMANEDEKECLSCGA